MITTFRDSIAKILPPWLIGYYGSRYAYAIAAQLDALGDTVVAAVRSRFPNVYSDETLPLLGRERGIRRGFDESAEANAGRLRNWLAYHRRAGNPYTLLRLIQGYLAGHSVRLRYVNNGGVWYTLNADGSVEWKRSSPTNWNWDGSTSQWSRFWVVIYPPADLWVRQGIWGDGGKWGDGRTWGSTATREQVDTINAIIAEWMGPHAQCVNVIVAFDDTAFDPTSSPGAPMPDGTWTPVAARDTRAIYWDGVI